MEERGKGEDKKERISSKWYLLLKEHFQGWDKTSGVVS